MVADTLSVVFRAEIADFLKGANRVNDSFRGMSHISVFSMATVGRAVANAGRAVLDFAVDTVKSGMEFEQAIADMRSVLPQVDQFGEDFDNLTAKIQELGATTTFTAVEASQAAQFLAMAGLSAKQTLDALPATLQLAAAGSLDLGKAADIATNVMSGFGLGAEDLSRIVDTLAFTASSSNTDIRGLGSSFSFVAATANGLGVSIESASAGIAALGNVGIQAGRAGRNLLGLLAELAKKGQDLGLDIFKANGELKDLSGILKGVEDAGLSTSDIIDKFGAISARTLVALMQTGSETLAEFEGKVRATGVTLENLTDIASATGKDFGNLSTAFENSKRTQEALGVTTTDTTALLLGLADAEIEGEQASEVFNKGLAQLADGAKQAGVDIFKSNGELQNFNVILQELGLEGKTTQELIETFGEEGAKVIEVLAKDGGENFAELSEKVREFAGEAEGAGSAMQEMKVDTLEGDLKLLTSAFDGLKQAITGSGLNDVIRQIVQGVTSLVEEATNFVNENKEALDDFFTELSTKIGPAVAQLRPQVIPVLTAIAESFVEVTARTVNFVSTFLSNKETLASAFTGISQAVSAVRDVFFGLLEAFAAMPAPMQRLVVGAAAISVILGPLLTLTTGFATGLISLTRILIPVGVAGSGVGAVLGSLLNPVTLVTAAIIGLAAAFATNFLGIRDVAKRAIDTIIPKFNKLIQLFEGDLAPAVTFLKTLFGGVANAIISVLGTAVGLVIDLTGDIINVFQGFFQVLKGVFTLSWKNIADGLDKIFGGLISAIIHLGEGLVSAVVDIVGNITSAFNKGIAQNWQRTKDAVTGFFTGVIDVVKAAFGIQSPSTVFLDIGIQIVQGLINGVKGMIQKAKDAISGLAGDVVGRFKNFLGIKSPSKVFLEAGNNIVQGLVEGIHAKQGEASEAAKELAQKTQEAFNLQMQALKTNLDLGIINPEDAKKALVELGEILKVEMQRLEDAGKNGSAAFIEIAKASKQVEVEIQNVDKAIAETIKKTHGVTEATTTWLNKLQVQSDLGLRPLVEIYNELEVRAKEVFAEIIAIQEGGLIPDELPIFEALIEKHGAVIQALESVEGKLAKISQTEVDLAADQIEAGALSKKQRIGQINAVLDKIKLTTEQEKILRTQLKDLTKQLTDEEEAFEKAHFDARLARGEVNQTEQIANLQAIVDKTKEGTAEREQAELALHNAIKGFEQERLDFEGARIQRLKAEGQNVLQLELDLANERLKLTVEGTAARQQALTTIANIETAMTTQRAEFEQREFELSRLRGEASLQDEIDREQVKLALLTENNKARVDQEIKVSNLLKQQAQQQSNDRKEQFETAKKLNVEAVETFVAGLEQELSAFQGNFAQRQAIEEDLTKFKVAVSKLRQKADEEESKKSIEAAEAVHRHNLKIGKLTFEDHQKWLVEQHKANEGNAKKQREIAEELLTLSKKTSEERANQFRKEQDDKAKEAEKTAKEEIELAEKVHRHNLKLGLIGVESHRAWLEMKIEDNKNNADERRKFELELSALLKKIDEEDTKASREQGKQRLKDNKSRTKQREENEKESAKEREQIAKELAKNFETIEKETHNEQIELNQDALAEYIQSLKDRASALERQNQTESAEYEALQERLTEADETFHQRRVALAIQEAEQKLAQATITKVGYVEELEAIMRSEGVSIEDRIDLAKKLADFKRDEFGSLSADEIKFLQNVLDKEQLTAKEVESVTKVLTGLIKDNAQDREDAHKLADKNAEDHAKKASKEIREAWERDTKAIVEALFGIANSLEDISPIAAGVFDFIGNLTKNVTAKLEGLEGKAFTAGDALQAIGSAAQSSSNLAVRSLGGVVNAIGQIASGNLIGGIVTGITTVVGAIGGLFGSASKKAQQLRQEIAKLNEFTKSIADGLKDIGIFSGLTGAQIEFDIKDLLGTDKDLKALDDFEKSFLDRIFGFRERVGEALSKVGAILKERFGSYGDILSGSGTELGVRAEHLLNQVSTFLGGYAAEIIRLEREISEVFQAGIDTSKFEEELEGLVDKVEFWSGEFNKAADFVRSNFAQGLGSIFVDGESLKNASKVLQDNFRKHIIQTMFQMAIESSGATTAIAAKMADLQVIMQEAFSTKNFDGVREAVASVARDLNKEFKELSEAVGGAIEDVFGGDLNKNATVNVTTKDNTTPVESQANVTVNLDAEGVEEFTAGTEQLKNFGDIWMEGVNDLAKVLEAQSLADSIREVLESSKLPDAIADALKPLSILNSVPESDVSQFPILVAKDVDTAINPSIKRLAPDEIVPEELSAFGNTWMQSVGDLGKFIGQFSMSTQELENRFLPQIDGATNMFSGSVNDFGKHVGDFGGHVNSFDGVVTRDARERANSARLMIQAANNMNRFMNRLNAFDIGNRQ